LGDDLQDGGVGGGFGVELEARGHLDFDVGRWLAWLRASRHCFDSENRACYHVVEIGEEALALTGVQLDGAEDVAELEAIDDHAGVVWKKRRP